MSKDKELSYFDARIMTNRAIKLQRAASAEKIKPCIETISATIRQAASDGKFRATVRLDGEQTKKLTLAEEEHIKSHFRGLGFDCNSQRDVAYHLCVTVSWDSDTKEQSPAPSPLTAEQQVWLEVYIAALRDGATGTKAMSLAELSVQRFNEHFNEQFNPQPQP